MHSIGVSNKFFYYTSSGKGASFNIVVRVNLCKPLNKPALSQAAAQALKEFPEFSVRPVIHDNKFFYEDNEKPPVLFEDDGAAHNFGSDETNGYLFYLVCGMEHFSLSFWHGLSDTAGISYLLMSILKHYAAETGGSARLPEKFMSRPDNLVKDPYGLFRNAPESAKGGANAFAFVIPEEQFPPESVQIYNYSVRTSLKPFIAMTKKLGVSFIPLLTYIVSGAIHDSYDTDGLPVTAMVPVDLRRFYGVETAENFSDGIFLPMPDGSRDPDKVCKVILQTMNNSLMRNTFNRVIAGKCQAVEKFESEDVSVSELAKKLTTPLPPDAKKPVTYALTYPGREDFSDYFPETVKSRDFYGMARAFFVVAYASGEELILRIGQRFRNPLIAGNIIKRLEFSGLSGVLTDEGLLIGSSLLIDELRKA